MPRLANLNAAVLVGGLGTRLRSVVADRPKALAKVAGQPFLTYLLDQFVAAQLKSAVLCTGYRAEAVRNALGTSYRGLELLYSEEASPLGTGGALRQARSLLSSDPVLILNGDSICRVDLAAFLDSYIDTGAAASLLLVEAPDTTRFGRVEVDRAGTIVGFSEKDSTRGPGLINAGIYLLSQELLHSLPEQTPLSLERDVFPSWLSRGLKGFRSDGLFIDIGTPESFAEAEREFRAHGLA